MLMIGYLILAIVSYLTIPAALEVAGWLALAFVGTFIYSVIGFAYSIPRSSKTT